MAPELTLATFAGPRSHLGEVLGALRAAGMPAELSQTKFHEMAEPETTEVFAGKDRIDIARELPKLTDIDRQVRALNPGLYDGHHSDIAGLLEQYELVPRFDTVELPPRTIADDTGAAVFDDTPTIDVLTHDLAAAQDVARRHDYQLRMHGPSGFASLDEADALKAAG